MYNGRMLEFHGADLTDPILERSRLLVHTTDYNRPNFKKFTTEWSKFKKIYSVVKKIDYFQPAPRMSTLWGLVNILLQNEKIKFSNHYLRNALLFFRQF